MKIAFDDKSYIDVQKSGDKVIIIIQAKDTENPRKNITNICELTVDQFKSICAAVNN